MSDSHPLRIKLWKISLRGSGYIHVLAYSLEEASVLAKKGKPFLADRFVGIEMVTEEPGIVQVQTGLVKG
jgi:hypothetical protein